MTISKAIPTRWTMAVALGALALATLAPAAQAGHGSKRSKHPRRGHYETRVVRHIHGPRVIVRETSCGAPALAGFLGGLILGAAVSHASTPEPAYAPPPPRYDYYDPYCDVSFRSLHSSSPHYRACRHPRVIRAIEVSSGECARTYRLAPAGWRAWEPEFDHPDWDEGGWQDYRD